MNLAELELLRLYQLVLLVAGVVGLYTALPGVWRLVTRYRKSPADLRRAIRMGVLAAAGRFTRQKWPGLVLLGLLLALLVGLTIAARLI